MPWTTPSLRDARSLVRDMIRGSLPGADANVPNSGLRVLSDNQGALTHLTLQYIDWLAKQLLPDTAETEWLDRHGDIWLINSDGTTGRKLPTLASGVVTATGAGGVVIPLGARLSDLYETTEQVTTAASGAATPIRARALDPGTAGNRLPGDSLSFNSPPVGASSRLIVVSMDGGVDAESDDDLRIRVLERIRQPPMGGAAHDYVAWAKRVPGVTRAWAGPLEMGMGTITTRFMMDQLRADNDGFPTASDILLVKDYINTVRPVATKDFFVVAPIKRRVDVFIQDLLPDTVAIRAAVESGLKQMLVAKALPGQTIYASWKINAIMEAPGVESFRLLFWADDVMESPGHMAVLGDIVYGVSPPNVTP